MKTAMADKKPKQRAKRQEKSGETNSPIWNCKVCIDQYMGGPRCAEHNPTPEMREANPTAYRREAIAVALRSPHAQITCRLCLWLGIADECNVSRKRGGQVRLDCPRCKAYIKFVAAA